MAFGITEIVVTPMQRLVVEWEDPPDAAAGFTVTATEDVMVSPHVIVEVVGADVLVARLDDQAKFGATYDVVVTAAIPGPDPDLSTAAVEVEVTPDCGVGMLLRQGLFDAIYGELEEIVSFDERDISLICDKYFRPTAVRMSVPLAVQMPAIEVGVARLVSARLASGARSEEEWRVPLRVRDAGNGEDEDVEEALWYLLERIRAVVDPLGQLALNGRGVKDLGWDWTVESKGAGSRDKQVLIEAVMAITVQRGIDEVMQGE